MAALADFFDALFQGPPKAEVTNINREDREVDEREKGFEIRD